MIRRRERRWRLAHNPEGRSAFQHPALPLAPYGSFQKLIWSPKLLSTISYISYIEYKERKKKKKRAPPCRIASDAQDIFTQLVISVLMFERDFFFVHQLVIIGGTA